MRKVNTNTTICITVALLLPLVFAYPSQAKKQSKLTFSARPPTLVQKAKDSLKARQKHDEIQTLWHDPSMNQQWGLHQINSPQAWAISKGSSRIIVAVIDTGIDTDHPDLKDNLWKNPGEIGLDSSGKDKSSNGIDDDNNGYIDDVHGWNFVTNNENVTDHHGHGTHIAGIIGAKGGNGIGISGVSPQVSLMVLKYMDPQFPKNNNLIATIKAIRYATKMKAQIINYSGGGLIRSAMERQAIQQAKQQGILFVAAAGNEKSNSDIHPYYPADYPLDNIISVTALDPSQKLLASSNFGPRTVDMAAPGQDIFSTLPQARYGKMSGTSQATAFVTGVAALILAHNPLLSQPQKLIRYLVSTGDHLTQLKGKTKYQVRLNSFRALTIQDQGVGAFGVIAHNLPRTPNEFFFPPQKPSGTPRP